MGKQSTRKLVAYLPLVLVATFLVVIVPMLLVLWLRKSGVVTSIWAGTAIGVAVSLLASYVGGAFWKARTGSRDILFSELMLWGWVQRLRSERRLIAAADVLGLTAWRPPAISGGHLTNQQKADLLTQLTSGLEARDSYTHGHSRRVARHASNIAKRMGLPREEVARIRAAGAMHDVGKVKTPIALLHKEGKLTKGEYAIIKRHPVDGAVMASTLGDEQLTAMVRHHHERLDGTGYPEGLAGQAIPIGARILAVADTFDAITSTRPYRQAHPHKKALDILSAEAGTQLDPDAVRAFCRCYTGRRPLAYWTILANARPRLATWLGAGLAPAKAAMVASVIAAAGTAGAVGGLSGAGADPDPTTASSEPRSSPRAPTPAPPAPKQTPSKPTRPRSPARPTAKGSGRRKAGGGHDRGHSDDLRARYNGPPYRHVPTQPIVQAPQVTPQAREKSRDPGRVRGHGRRRGDDRRGQRGGRRPGRGRGQAPPAKPRKPGKAPAPEGRPTPAPAKQPDQGNGEVGRPPPPDWGGLAELLNWLLPPGPGQPPARP